MIQSASKLIEETIQDTRKWLAERASFDERLLKIVNEELSDVSESGIRGAEITLGMLSTYYARIAQIRIIDGDSSGWQIIRKAVAYHFWELKIIATEFFERDAFDPERACLNLTNFTNDIACYLCYFLVAGNAESHRFMLNLLLRIATFPKAVDEPYWSNRIFEPFILVLHQKLLPLELPDSVTQRNFGPYHNVLLHWEDDTRFGEAIYGICEYHVENFYSRPDGWKCEFTGPPFDLLPAEVLAIYAIRRQLGLSVPNVDHPLLKTPLMKLEPDPSLEMDEVLIRVQSVYEKVFKTG